MNEFSFNSYEEAVQYLFSKPAGKQTVFAKTIEECEQQFAQRKRFFHWLLAFLYQTRCTDDPSYRLEDKIIVHVAGTNGKGSVVAMVDSCLRAAGLKTGCFTSPHLHTVRERIRVNGELIPKEKVIKLASEIYHLEQISASIDPSADTDFVPMPNFFIFFDRLLILALAYFIEQKVEALVLEVGLGGRFDATNIFYSVSASIITSISFDHHDPLDLTLGQLAEIAWQKAGILKNGAPAFASVHQPAEVQTVLEAEATRVGAWISFIDEKDIQALISSGKCTLSLNPREIQLQNASLVLAALKRLFGNTPATLEQALKGFQTAYWPARYEQLQLTSGHTLIIDGAHNVDGLCKLLDNVEQDQANKSVYILFGCGSEDWESLLQCALKRAHRVVLVQSSHFKAVPRDQLLSHITAKLPDHQHKLLDIGANFTVNDALLSVVEQLKDSKDTSVVLVTGSLFVAAEARVACDKNGLYEFPANDWVKFNEVTPSGYK